MKNWINTILNSRSRGHTPPLSPEEKSSLQSDFFNFMDKNPLPKKNQGYVGTWNYAVPQIALIVLFIGLGSISYIAEEAEPDDLLYAVKRNVNEEILLGVSGLIPEYRAEVDTLLLSRRFEDIEKLIISDNFEDADSIKLQNDIDEHTGSIHTYISEAESAGETKKALRAGMRLDTLLDAHVTILSTLEDDGDTHAFLEETTRKRDHTEAIKENLLEIEAFETPFYETEDIQVLVDEINKVHALVTEQETDLQHIKNEQVRTEIENSLQASSEARKRADMDLQRGDDVSAVKELRRAIDDASIASILLDLHEELYR